MSHPLYIAFVWHMHQPYYKDTANGEVILPWVRLHGIKDYLDMVELLKDYPHIHQTFNLTPVLLYQIEELISDNCSSDRFFKIANKAPDQLSDEEKEFILNNFFMANWDHMIKPYPRYEDLLLKRGKYLSPAQIVQIKRRFKTQDYLDLQVWFNLAWFDPSFKIKDPLLKGLIEKGANFTDEDKQALLQKQIDTLKKIIPTYRHYQESKQIELSTSPYYHPILPLILDTFSAREALPKIDLPAHRFQEPQDAKWHIEEAVRDYERHFGTKPLGLWPSEGAVSEGIMPFVIEAGIKWVATDEELLWKSIGKGRSAATLYAPYLVKREKGSLNIVFRDRQLSDMLGFVYSNWSADLAVDDFIKRLRRIKEELPKEDSPYLVSIILDGENAWEYYTNDGRDFLKRLYSALTHEQDLRAVTISEFLKSFPPKKELRHIVAGSWIGGNLATWIGHKEKNKSWDALYSARQELVKFQKAHPSLALGQDIEKGWRQIYIAEGSDYNWWYGDEHTSATDEEFDALYRSHLSGIYKIIGQSIPDYLKTPIKSKTIRPRVEPVRFITPVLDGRDTTYYEWLYAGYFDVARSGGTMHRSQSFVKCLYYGFDLTRFYLRIDMELPDEREDAKDLKVIVNIPSANARVELPLYKGVKRAELFKETKDGRYIKLREFDTIAYDKLLEIGIERSDVGLKENEELMLQIILERHGLEIERIPDRGPIRLLIPAKDYESRVWYA